MSWTAYGLWNILCNDFSAEEECMEIRLFLLHFTNKLFSANEFIFNIDYEKAFTMEVRACLCNRFLPKWKKKVCLNSQNISLLISESYFLLIKSIKISATFSNFIKSNSNVRKIHKLCFLTRACKLAFSVIWARSGCPIQQLSLGNRCS